MSGDLVSTKWSEAITRWRTQQKRENEHAERRQQLLDAGIGQKELLAIEIQIHRLQWQMYDQLIEEAKAQGGSE